MSVVITPEIEQMVQAIIRTGQFKDETAVVKEGLRLIQQREKFREEMRQSLAEADRGELLDEEQFFRELEDYADQLSRQSQ